MDGKGNNMPSQDFTLKSQLLIMFMVIPPTGKKVNICRNIG